MVTGSTGGIGLATAALLAEERARVVTCGRGEAPGVGEALHVVADLGLPDEPARLALLRLNTARMPTVAVRLEEIARETGGMSPADIKALCQEAALAAMGRGAGDGGAAAGVTHADFTEALTRLRSPREASTGVPA